MAQLAERSLPTLDVRGSNPVIGKIFYLTCAYCLLLIAEKKEKRPGMAHLKSYRTKYVVPIKSDPCFAERLHAYLHLQQKLLTVF